MDVENEDNKSLGGGARKLQRTEEVDTSAATSGIHESFQSYGDSPKHSGSKDNLNVMEQDEAQVEGELGQDADDSEVDSDNEQDEEEVEDEDEEEELVELPKATRRGRGPQFQADTVFGDFSFAGDGEDKVESFECVKSLGMKSQRWVKRDSCNVALVNTQKEFVCVKFPALIKNKDKALACLGGVGNVLESMNIGKLDAVLRPDNPYSKPAIGLFSNNKNLLVKCRRRKKVADVNQPSTSASVVEGDNLDDGYEYKIEVLGIVAGVFRFERPFDFQYLPVIKKTDRSSGYEELLTKLTIKFEDTRQSFINRDVPLFLPPYAFSRSERPAKYVFQDDENRGEKHIGAARKLRNAGTYRMTFSYNMVPDYPHENAKKAFISSARDIEPLKQLFQERPLWSKVGVMSRLRAISEDLVYLKRHLNMVAYSFSTGPWIHLWCRFGYDPRKNVEAKMYQTIDFRIRRTYHREKVTAKRSAARILGRQGMNTIKGHLLPSMDTLVEEESKGRGGDSAAQTIDTHYQFSPGKMPPHRQMFYQVCDVFIDDVQRLVHQNDGKETVCTERDGWCIPDFLSLSRDILAEHAEALLKSKKGTGVGKGIGDVI